MVKRTPAEPVTTPETTERLKEMNIIRTDADGVILGETPYYPAVLPMAGIDFEEMDYPFLYVFAMTNKGGAKRGGRYSVKAVTHEGLLIVNGVQGAQKMTDFCLALRGPFQPEPANSEADTGN